MARILVVEDEPDIALGLQLDLSRSESAGRRLSSIVKKGHRQDFHNRHDTFRVLLLRCGFIADRHD